MDTHSDGLIKRVPGARKKGEPLFSASTFFCPKNMVIFKKSSSLSIKYISYFRPKVKVQTGGHRHGATIKKK